MRGQSTGRDDVNGVSTRAARALLAYRGWIIPAIYALAIVPIARRHDIFTEWGGVMMAFSGREMMHGLGYHGWASHFWPPLYAFLLGVGGQFLPELVAGKLVSIAAGTALLVVVYQLALQLFPSVRVALLSQLLVALNPLFVLESFQAHNHMLSATLVVTGLYLFLKHARARSLRGVLAAGVVCGLASLARYQSLVLVSLAVTPFFMADLRSSTRLAAQFLAGFLLVCVPWWSYGVAVNGSALYTWQYLNLGATLYPGDKALWWWSEQTRFHGAMSVLAAYPQAYIRNFLANLSKLPLMVLLLLGPIGVFVVGGIFDSVVGRLWKRVVAVYFLLFVYVLVVCQVFVPTYEIISVVVTLTIVGAAFVARHAQQVQHKHPLMAKLRYSRVLVAGLALTSALITNTRVRAAVADRYNGDALTEVDRVADVIRGHDPALARKVVMAKDPGWAYHFGSRYVETPASYRGDAAGLVRFAGLSAEIKSYVPRFPSTLAGPALRADYLVYTREHGDSADADDNPFPVHEPRGLDFLLDPRSPQIPPSFHAVYRSNAVVVYEVSWDSDANVAAAQGTHGNNEAHAGLGAPGVP
jgi:hypothetical protein